MVYLVMLATVMTAIYFTDSRGVLLSVGLIVLMEVGKRKGMVKAAVLGAILAVVAVGYTRLSELDVDEASAAGRIEAWYQGTLMFKSHPILGVGYGNFTEHHRQTAHNSYMLVLAETGVVGFYFWFALISITLAILINFLRKSKDDLDVVKTASEVAVWEEYRGITWAYLVLLLGYLTSITFLSRSYDTYFYIVFAVGTGLCFALQSRYKVVPNLRIVNKMGGWGFSAIAGAIFILLSIKILLNLQG